MLEALQSISDTITMLLVAAGVVLVLVIIFQAFKTVFFGVKAMFRRKRP